MFDLLSKLTLPSIVAQSADLGCISIDTGHLDVMNAEIRYRKQ